MSAPARERRRAALLLPSLAGGGAERVALAIAADLLAKGHAVDLILVERRGELLDHVPSGARVIDLGARRLRSALAPLVSYLRRERPDGLQAFMWPLTIVAVVAHRLARSKARLVLSDHGTLSKEYAGFPMSALLRLSLRGCYPLADARVAVSRGAAADMARLSGLPLETFEVLANPVLLPQEPASDASAERLWQGAAERIVSVGSLSPVKNHALLIRAFASLRERRPAARLVILGEGSERPALEQLVARLGLDGAVLLPGFVPDPAPVLASADLFALSSNSEAAPLVLVEALNAGLRIVSTNCQNGPAEMLAGGRYGLLAPVGDAEALAEAMLAGLSAEPQPERQRQRARELAGAESFARYEELMLGPAADDRRTERR